MSDSKNQISRADWECVERLAKKIADASLADDEVLYSHYVEEMNELLDRLEHTYGLRASLLETRSHYINDPNDRLQLLFRGLELAKEQNDTNSSVSIVSLIASVYIEELEDEVQGTKWLANLERVLIEYEHQIEVHEWIQLKENLKDLIQRKGESGEP